MKRLVIFFASLIIFFAITFLISAGFFPEWLEQSSWSKQLSKKIIIGGLIILAEIFLSWFFSFIFGDKDIAERIIFLIGNKYKDISNTLDEVTQSALRKEKQSKKYIPNVFVETTEVKEKLRYFSEPFIFYPKIISHTEKTLQGSIIVNTLKQIHFPLREPHKPKLRKIKNKGSLNRQIEKYKKFLDQKRTITDLLVKNGGVGLKPEFKSKVPAEFSHIYEYVSHNLQYYRSFEYDLEEAIDDLDLLENKIAIIKSVAGHGKTNLLCDFAENFFIRKGHKCLYISTRELNYLGEQETIEQAISRIIFTESEYQFSDIIRLIKFDKKIGQLFILIDGINEHKDLTLFSTALEQFIQRNNSQDIKFILTCRSEYFDDRFGNLLQIEGISVIDIDEWNYSYNIPDVYQNTLLAGYFSEFNIKMNPNKVAQEIAEAFYKDKLLLRIFCEAFENERPAEYLDNLYKLEIFNRYYEKKSETIPRLQNSLIEIINWMLERDEFTDIQISNLSKETNEVIEETAYENVIIRKDVINDPDLAFSKVEVVNFVYDEFRDYLIASQIVLLWDQDNQSSREQILRITNAIYMVSEGVQKYLCLWAIRNDKRELLDYLSSFNRFDTVFVDSMFESPDTKITVYSIGILERIFLSNPKMALKITFGLSYRPDDCRYPNLNIDLLLLWLA